MSNLEKLSKEFREAMDDGIVSQVKEILNRIKEETQGKYLILENLIDSFGALEEGQKDIGALLFLRAKTSMNGERDLNEYVDQIIDQLYMYLSRPFGKRLYKYDRIADHINLRYKLDEKYKIKYRYRSTILDKEFNFVNNPNNFDVDQLNSLIDNSIESENKIKIKFEDGQDSLKVEEDTIYISSNSQEKAKEYFDLLESIIRQNPYFIRNIEIKKL